MKNQMHSHSASFAKMKNPKASNPAFAAVFLAVLAAVTMAWLPTAKAAPAPPHNISAANINVVQNDTNNTAASVTITASNVINDFRIRSGGNRGDFNVQVGDDPTDDGAGLLLTSVTQNGRDNGEEGNLAGTIFAISMTQPNANGYFIPVNTANGNFAAGANPEWNVNVAAAWFPTNYWLVGYAFNAAGLNGSGVNTNDALIGSPQLVYGVHFLDRGSGGGANAGKSVVDLTSLGYDSRSNGVLIVNGAKNESANFALSQVNTNNGTWNVILRDTGNTGANGEQDPVAFAFIPKTNDTVVSGRFLGDATIDAFSGTSPQFTVTQLGIGQYELKMTGHSPANGVLIISPEGGGPINFDNIVNYQVNPTGDGWVIESRDTGGGVGLPTPALESPGPTEGVVSFVYIPGPTPGVAVAPTNNLFTSENGDSATFTVVLETMPTADVTIDLASDNPLEGVAAPFTLVFTPNDWNLPQTVTITGQDDPATDGPVAYLVVLSAVISDDANYNGQNPSDVAVVNLDNEGGITINPTSGLTTTETGGPATFTIVLNQSPTADVTIGLRSSDPTEGDVSVANVTFTASDWNLPQTVTITGVDDFVDDGNIDYTIITAPAVSADPFYNAKNPTDISVSNVDDDTAGIIVNPPFGLSVVEAGSATNFTIVLASEPTANVVIDIVSADTTEGTVAPATVTFTPSNWNTEQAVTITPVNDLLIDGNITYTVTNTTSSSDPLYAAINATDVQVTTLDNEMVLTLPSGGAVWGTAMPAIGIDGRATVVDPYTADYENATLTVALTTNATADDRLEIRDTGTGAGQISVSGDTVSYEGNPVATFSGGAGTTPLVVTFNFAATPAAAQALLRSVTFRSVSAEPSLALRSVTVSLARIDGAIASTTTTVRVGLLRVSDFQEGADHGFGIYTGAADIELNELQPDITYPTGRTASGLLVDWREAENPNGGQILLRFDNIIGDGPGQIPSNSIVVSAELLLDINDTGDGSPLHRMMIPWNADAETWNSIGGGVFPDDTRARVAFDSQIGLANGDASTSTGTIITGVTPDVQAWVSGSESNYGWVMPAWPLNLDGTFFSPSEAPNVSDRPRLRVLWLPAGTASASFRQGVNDYTSAFDTRIRQNAPATEFSTVNGVFVDAEVTGGSPNPEQVLLRFDSIIGSETNQIPAGARIHAAMLDLSSTIGNAMGDGGTFHAMLQPWQDTSNWDELLNGISTDDVEAAAAPTASAGNATLNPNVQAAFLSFEMTADVQNWSSSTRTNYGWVVVPWPGGGDGWGFGTAEQGLEQNRPRLRVYYTPGAVTPQIVAFPPTVTATSVVIRFSGAPNTPHSILRSGTLTGQFTSIGTASTGLDGTGTFTDSAPLPDSAFYRISNP
jgi:hypothetical protein